MREGRHRGLDSWVAGRSPGPDLGSLKKRGLEF